MKRMRGDPNTAYDVGKGYHYLADASGLLSHVHDQDVAPLSAQGCIVEVFVQAAATDNPLVMVGDYQLFQDDAGNLMIKTPDGALVTLVEKS